MAKSLLVSWLNDAYAMEQAQQKMLKGFIKDFDDHPDIRAKLEQHLTETEDQADTIKECLEALDEEPSGVKSALGDVMGAIQGMSTSMYKDELVKDMIMIHAGEHFEHACYLALAEAAETLGENDIARTCTEIAAEEKAMAEWSEQQLPIVVNLRITEDIVEADEE